MNDGLSEEEQIASEQDNSRTNLSSESFTRAIKEISMPSIIALDEATELGEVVSLMQSKKIGSVVLTKNGELSGILTERDLLMKVLGIKDDWKKVRSSEVMTKDPQSLRADDEIAYVLNNMHVGGYRHVPIVDSEGRPVGMVSIKDVVSWILDHFPGEITNLTGEPYRGAPSRDGG